ncbi:MAG TPA: hypothetical protein VHK69_15160, partial [Chitinophagaceae bacterium]|nr:hypothetical protein [Chitinophagaceae bacterium]
IGGIKLMVHHAHAERAWDLMEGAEKAYLRRIPCPVCKKHELELVSITREHKCRLSALVSMLLNGRSIEVTRMYRCTACGYDFRELPDAAHG